MTLFIIFVVVVVGENTLLNELYECFFLFKVLSKVNYFAASDLKQTIMTQTGTQPIYYLRYAFDGKEYSYHQLICNITVLNGELLKKKLNFIYKLLIKSINSSQYSGTAHADSELVFLVPTYIKYKVPMKDHPVALKTRQLLRLYSNFAKYG